jgi:hypothetical protein
VSADRALSLLARWAENAERHWHPIPGRPEQGCYGTGYNNWGVQTNQKYLAALAVLAARGRGGEGMDPLLARERALAALRFSLDSHVSGEGSCTDGTKWGHTWISALGIERMMHAVGLLEPDMRDGDREALKRVRVSEADWLLTGYERGGVREVAGGLWNSGGRNHPESNIWNGALLWRTAAACSHHPRAAEWRERAHAFLVNGVSVPADADDGTVVAGKPVRERFGGANFFPNFALDHHGYLNVGYMAICVSNAAMLHFDLELAGLERPESLDHHEFELWAVLRRMVFSGGRLARIGGDTRVRYCYCQEYLLPALLYAADRFGDGHALPLAEAQLELMAGEAEHNGDGSFFGRRLAALADRSPYYYTRLESDRACVLGQYVAYRPLVKAPPSPAVDFEASASGGWSEPEHGAVMHRAPRRLAAFAWRAFGLAQGTCQPPDDPHLSDWEGNLTGRVEFTVSQHALRPVRLAGRRLLDCWTASFDGGFVTVGAAFEGAEVALAEGWRGKDMAVHRIAFAALPDERTVVGLELCQLGAARGCVRAVKGLGLNLANDLYNGFERVLACEGGEVLLRSPADRDGGVGLASRWLSTGGRLGVVGVYGASELAVHRSPRRRGGAYESLYVDEVCWPGVEGPRWFDPGAVLLDCGWAVLSAADEAETRACAGDPRTAALDPGVEGLRGLSVLGADGNRHFVVVNFSDETADLPVAALVAEEGTGLTEHVSGDALRSGGDDRIALEPGRAIVLTEC